MDGYPFGRLITRGLFTPSMPMVPSTIESSVAERASAGRKIMPLTGAAKAPLP
jgi:hypothetical protein